MSEHTNLPGRYEFDTTNPSMQTGISALPSRSMDEIVEQLDLGIRGGVIVAILCVKRGFSLRTVPFSFRCAWYPEEFSEK
jgi:hypothetical protein